MPKRQPILRIKLMFVEPPPAAAESDGDSSDSDSGESLKCIMRDFKKQMEDIDAATNLLTGQVAQLYTRAKVETTDWLNEPLLPKPALRDWLAAHELPPRPTLEEFFDVSLDSAKSLDLESRMVTFHRADAVALWGGRRRMTIFEVLSQIPTLFE